MLLAVDVGNTLTHLGVFDRGTLNHEWQASTKATRTADELALLFRDFLSLADLSFTQQISGVVISSVVPRVTQEMRAMTDQYFGFPPIVVEPGVRTGIAVLTDNPREVGADRIANAVAAHALWPGEAVIVVDFGTATNLDVVSTRGEYLGGAIAPGLDSSAEGLFRAAAQIGRVELVAPPSAIGKTTVTCVQSGIMYGSAAMIDGLIDRISEELGGPVRVVATGGRASTVIEHCRRVKEVEPALTLYGLREIYERNSEE